MENGPPDAPLVMALAAALRQAGREEDGVALLQGYLAPGAGRGGAEEARGRLERVGVERAARSRRSGAAAPGPRGRRRAGAARRGASADPQAALEALRELVRRHPRSAAARAALGEVYAALGQIAEAEQAYGWASALEPDDPEWHLRLGLLLSQRYGGRRHAEALDALSRARALRPAQPELLFHLGRVQQELGAFDVALPLFQECARLDPGGPMAGAALERIADLRRSPPDFVPLPELSSPPADVPQAALDGYRVARVYLDRGEVTRARAELLPVLKLAPGWAAAMNLQAGIAARDEDWAAAVSAWERSLAAEPNQPRVRLALAEVALREGDQGRAVAFLEQAAAGGVAEAWFRLASLAFEAHDLLLARERLDAYFATSAGGLDQEPARQLQRVVTRRIQLAQGAGLGGIGLVLGALALVLLRRRAGRSLEAFVAENPEASHDLARIVSALRHEVIKHNTTLLEEVALALERGEHHAVAFAAERLYGDGVEAGVIGRFDGYLDALERLGRRHGRRLDLRRKDPVVAPMARAMDRLRRLEGPLRRPWRAPAATPGRLRAIAQALNEDAYAGLGELLGRLGTTAVGPELVLGTWARVRAEANISRLSPCELAMSGREDTLPARIFAGDLEDVLANLLRNAVTAACARGDGSGRVGVCIEEEEDPITGQESVLLRVLDDAPGRLETADIHTRGIGRGLGLTADLIARHDGSIGVERRPAELAAGWTKAIVVRLRRAEVAGPVPRLPTSVQVELDPDEADPPAQEFS